jgi:hypothetical protein
MFRPALDKIKRHPVEGKPIMAGGEELVRKFKPLDSRIPLHRLPEFVLLVG